MPSALQDNHRSPYIDAQRLPRDRAAEREEARPSFSLAAHVPAFLHSVAGAPQRGEAIGLGITDADGKLFRFRLPRGSALTLLEQLLIYRGGANAQSDRSSGIPSPDGSPNEGQPQVPEAAASAAAKAE